MGWAQRLRPSPGARLAGLCRDVAKLRAVIAGLRSDVAALDVALTAAEKTAERPVKGLSVQARLDAVAKYGGTT